MTQEEKAKAYDEALKKLHEIITMDNHPVLPKEIGEFLFPELAESEDEKIRGKIVAIIEQYGRICEKEGDPCLELNDCLTWLEKQKEQQPAEWSEEDEKNFYWISTRIQQANMTPEYSAKVYEILSWLESLRPQPKEELGKMLQDIYNKGKEISNRIEMLEKKIGLY